MAENAELSIAPYVKHLAAEVTGISGFNSKIDLFNPKGTEPRKGIKRFAFQLLHGATTLACPATTRMIGRNELHQIMRHRDWDGREIIKELMLVGSALAGDAINNLATTGTAVATALITHDIPSTAAAYLASKTAFNTSAHMGIDFLRWLNPPRNDF